MGQLIRDFDWSTTILGSPGTWPQSLRISLGNLLNSGFPMFLFWGDELICFYNDAFRPSLGEEGKHPAIGKPAKEVWFDIWNFVGPLIESVMATGKAVWYEDQLIPFHRNGKLEDIYWTFSYSAIVNEEGVPEGVMATCIETTRAVANRKKMQESANILRKTILHAPIAICMFCGPDYKFDIVNPQMAEMLGRDLAFLEGKPLLEAVPELKNAGLKEILDKVALTGETYLSPEQEFTINREHGPEPIIVKYIYEPMFDDSGKPERIMAVAIDVTQQAIARQKIEEIVAQRTRELASANEALLLSNTELQRSNANLEEFAHAASHDLKEPIRKIHFFTNHLKQQLLSQLGEAEIRAFSRIENATNRMGILIDDLLLYSHVSVQPYEMETIDLNQKIRRVLEDLELDIQQKSVDIKLGHLPTIKGYRRQI